jgi:hypothetical protein
MRDATPELTAKPGANAYAHRHTNGLSDSYASTLGWHAHPFDPAEHRYSLEAAHPDLAADRQRDVDRPQPG